MIGNITLSGILIDSTGNAIAGAKVVLKSVKTGDVISGLAGSFTTGVDGSSLHDALPILQGLR